MSGQTEVEPRIGYTLTQVSLITGLKASEIRYFTQLGLVSPLRAENISGRWFLLDENGQPGEEIKVPSSQEVWELRNKRLRRKTP